MQSEERAGDLSSRIFVLERGMLQTFLFSEYDRVRLKGDPFRIGIATGQTRSGRGNRGERYQIKFPDTTQWVPGDQLERVPHERETPVDLLTKGSLGRVGDLRRTLTHVRLTGKLTDVIYSLETTNTDFYSYQFKPVLRFLHSPSNALLIADEVGLGKTIEAGLVWTELRSRYDLSRLVVLCPAMLREKWKQELEQKIGVHAEIVNARTLTERLKQPRRQSRGFALIASQEGMRPAREWETEQKPQATAELARYLRKRENDEPLIDLLIVDEAHYLRNSTTQTHEMGQLFRRVSANLLLLTATPIHNRNKDLFSLLQLLDPDIFERAEDLATILEASRPLVKARDQILSPRADREKIRSSLQEASEHPILQNSRQLQAARDAIDQLPCLSDRSARAQIAHQLELINPLAYVITRTRKRDVKEWRVIREPHAEMVVMTEAERRFYDVVTECVVDYAKESDQANEGFLLAMPQRQMSSSMPATLRAWLERRENIDEVYAASKDRSSGEEQSAGTLIRTIISQLPANLRVEELIRNDSKLNRVRKTLSELFREDPTAKVVLFSTFRETLHYLGEQLEASGIPNLLMHGGIRQPKHQILEAFRTDPSIRLLLSSEVGSEGIDLQFCRVLINYDLPWNPMRVEQRIGRLDRLGQEANRILIWNLLYADTIDARIYSRLYEKLDLCRRALGDFEEVLGNQLRELTTDLLSDHLSPEQQERRIDQTAQALENLRREQEELENQAAHLVAYGDYILENIRDAHEMNRRIVSEDLQAYVIEYFNLSYPGCSFRMLTEGSSQFQVKLSPQAQHDLASYIRGKQLATDTSLIRPSSDSVTCLFENRTTSPAGKQGEMVNQFHPLVHFVSDSIDRQEQQVNPAVGVVLPMASLGEEDFSPGDYLVAAARWSVSGLQTLEKLEYRAVKWGPEPTPLTLQQAERLVAAAAKHGRDWLECLEQLGQEQVVEIVDQQLFLQLDEDFESYVQNVQRQNDDLIDLQMSNLNRHLEQQMNQLRQVQVKHQMMGRTGLVKATEGRMEALKQRVERRRLEIEEKRKIQSRSDEVLVVVVRIDNDI